MGEKQSKHIILPNTPTSAAENNGTNNINAPQCTHPTLDTLLKGQLSMGTLFNQTVAADVVAKISDYAPEMATANRYSAASSKIAGADQIRNQTILKRLLQAVAYGMESKEANVPVKASDADNLFKANLFAIDLLDKSPEFLLARGDVTDWAGREFKNITAFEYALWAKDFKMIEMMLHFIPETEEGDEIRAVLLEQYKQVTAPIYAGGGLTYTHTYNRPNLDALGIPDGTTTRVTEKHTENHFDITTICDAYHDYSTHYNNNIDGSPRNSKQRADYWFKLIGTLQLQLPVHVLQRYCDPNTPFYPIKKGKTFHGVFQRSTYFFTHFDDPGSSIFNDNPCSFTSFAYWRNGADMGARLRAAQRRETVVASVDLEVLRQLDEVSTNEIEKIAKQLSQPRHAASHGL